MLHHCDRMLAEEPQNDRLPQDWRKYRLASQADTGTRPLQNRPCPRQPPFARVLTVLLPINAIQIVWVNLLCRLRALDICQVLWHHFKPSQKA